MKYINKAMIIGLMVFTWNALQAQQSTQDFTIPLSNPNDPGKLAVSLHNGKIRVESHSGKDVLISVKVYRSDKNKDSYSRQGLKRIPKTGADFEILENRNIVQIKGGNKNRADYTIKVPQEFSLSIKTHHDGDVYVQDVSGTIVVDAHHGGIQIENVKGSVLADTHHGSIKVSFSEIKSGVPMAFSTYHGDVDVTFPSNINASAKMKSIKGDIYTDFEMELKPTEPQTQQTRNNGRKIVVSNWIYSNIGSGGTEYMFTTHHGDIILRKK